MTPVANYANATLLLAWLHQVLDVYFAEPIQISAIYIHEINSPGVTQVGSSVSTAGKLQLVGGEWVGGYFCNGYSGLPAGWEPQLGVLGSRLLLGKQHHSLLLRWARWA